MEAGTYVAIYAAVVATGALVWNVAQALRARKADVVVTIRMDFCDNGLDLGLRDYFAITVVNCGQVPVALGSLVGVDDQSDPNRTPMSTTAHDLPSVLEPGAGATARLHLGLIEAFADLAEPLSAWVELGSGERVRSKRVRVRSVAERAG